MEIGIVNQLSALAHPKRLDLFRLLMRRYPDSVSAGEIARTLDLKANTASVYLSTLRQVGLIRQDRVGVSLFYQSEISAMRDLVGVLLNDCCQNRPDICLTGPYCEARSEASQPPYNLLFICTANSARSIMAEAILNKIGADRFTAYSAGVAPATGPQTEVLQMLREQGHDISDLTSKNVDQFTQITAPKMDFVITVCDRAANDDCPIWSGQPIQAHWGLPDPVHINATASQATLAYRQCYDALTTKLRAFVDLPIETLDRVSLQHALDDIARGIAA